MSLARKILDIFCNSGTSDIGIFGSKYNGSSDVSSDPDDIQRGQGGNNTNWAEGWARAIVTNQAPCLEDMNGVMYVLSYMTKYLYQTGIPEWNSGETYSQWALTQYGGSLYISVYNGDNVGNNPSSTPEWQKLSLTFPWVAGKTYSVGDIVNYNGRTYKCIRNHTASSLFETDYNGKVLTSSPLTYECGNWDDGSPAGTIVHSMNFNKPSGRDANGDDPFPYNYFDITGADAGREISKSTYANLYEVIGNTYNNCPDLSTYPISWYPNPSSGNFRLPDLRSTFLKNSGTYNSGFGHNASHTHAHNYTSSRNLAHNHYFPGFVPFQPVSDFYCHYRSYYQGAGSLIGEGVWTVTSGQNASNTNSSLSTNLSIPALSLNYQGSGNSPEPSFYGTRILLKY